MNTLVDTLARTTAKAERRQLLEAACQDASTRTRLAAGLQSGIVARLYSDPDKARRLGDVAADWAKIAGDPLSAALAMRGRAHLEFTRGNNAAAVKHYQAAAGDFRKLGEEMEEARTLSSGLQGLIYLGRYEEAREWASRAERAFLKFGDALRLARLDSNVGNIHFRLDQPREAIARYERALETLQELGDDKDSAAVLSNLVVSHTSLGHFAEAFAYYRRVTDLCASRGLSSLTAQADYNIAYLYFLRGEYAEARLAYERSRQLCRQTDDAYHAALCDLDESELALELNLTAEGQTFARQAAVAFEKLGMRYEQAKALVNLAVAASQSGALAEAGRLLTRARRLFVAEKNLVWPALIDLQRAVLAFHEGRYPVAQRLSTAAGAVLAQTMMPARAAQAQLLLARLWLRTGQLDRARAVSRQALAHDAAASSPSLAFHAGVLEGEVNERQGKWVAALDSYESARAVLEDLRGRLDTEDLRISMLADKLVVYESLVAMLLDSPLASQDGSTDRALLLVQQAKSRSLADRLMHPGGVDARPSPESDRLRSELNWHYRQIETITLLARCGSASAAARAAELQRSADGLEAQLIEANTRRRGRERAGAAAILAPVSRIETLQRAIAPGCVLVEYFEARGILWAFVLKGKTRPVAIRLGPVTPVLQSWRLLSFQLSKAGIAGTRAGLAEACHHLGDLYNLLIRPLESHLGGCRHLTVAPHRKLHQIPFGALRDGKAPLMDRMAVSVTPSASVYAARRRVTKRSVRAHSVVVAVPDPHNPYIEREARQVAELLAGPPRLFVGESATRETFLREAARARVLHLAAHGIFRRDNPLFSALQLADERLSLLDLSTAKCEVDLLTLSSCSSGVSLAVGGDELLGLMRGFLAAGVRRLVVSLWEVNDAATSEFMRFFYTALGRGLEPAWALAEAAREMRALHPHPFFWAPFVLAGDSPG